MLWNVLYGLQPLCLGSLDGLVRDIGSRSMKLTPLWWSRSFRGAVRKDPGNREASEIQGSGEQEQRRLGSRGVGAGRPQNVQLGVLS